MFYFSLYISNDIEKNWSKTEDDSELLKTLLVVGGLLLIAVVTCVGVLFIFRQARKA